MNTPEPEYFTGSAASRTGLVSVETTELGLPTAISVHGAALRGDPHVLADEIMRLCRQAGNRARLARRRYLLAPRMLADVSCLIGRKSPSALIHDELVRLSRATGTPCVLTRVERDGSFVAIDRRM